MANFGTTTGQKFAKNALMVYFQNAVAPEITNQDYEGEVRGGGSDRVNILTFSTLTLKSYTGSAMTPDTPAESSAQLIVNQKKAYYFQIEGFAKFTSYVENPESTLIKTAGLQLAENVDSYVLGLYADVASGNRVGTDYTTGTVEVTVTTGAVTGSGTTFTSAMVGLGFKATGHTSWYRIKTYTSGTAIVIEDDKDDATSAYTGGAISAGATYTIEASTKVQVTASTIYGYIASLKTKLDQAKVPTTDRALIVPADVANVLVQSTQLIPAVAVAYDQVVTNGLLGTILGFKVYQTEQVSGNNTSGYYVLAVHKSWCTLAMAMTKAEVEPFIGGDGQNFKGFLYYGAKVVDERRKAGAYLYCYR